MTQYTGQPLGYSNFTPGQVAVTSAAAQLPANKASEVVLSAPSTNTAPVFIGNSSGVTDSTGLSLSPGASITLKVANSNMLWVIAAAAQTLTYAVLV